MFVGCIGIQRDLQAKILESHCNVLGHPKSAAKIQVVLRLKKCIAQFNAMRRCRGIQRNSRARNQRLQQHVAGAGAAAGDGMKTCDNKRLSRLDLAGEAVVETALCAQSNQRGPGALL